MDDVEAQLSRVELPAASLPALRVDRREAGIAVTRKPIRVFYSVLSQRFYATHTQPLPRCWRYPRRWCPGVCQYVLRHEECYHDDVEPHVQRRMGDANAVAEGQKQEGHQH